MAEMQMTTYKYAGRGLVADPIAVAVRLGHELGNRLTEIRLAYEAAKAAAWEEDPVAGPLLRAAAAAAEACDAAAAESASAKQRAGYAAKTGNTARLAIAQEDARAARSALAAARTALREAKAAVRAMKEERWPAAQSAILAAREEMEAAIKATYPEFRDKGMFWALWSDVVAHHRTAVARVTEARKQGKPAALHFRRFNGTGSATVQIQRELGVTPEDRAQVAALRAQGLTPSQIGELTGRPAMTVARMKDEGPEKPGDPPCTPAILASGGGKWKNVLQVSGLPEGFADLPRGQRRRLARTGQAVIRTGAGTSAAQVTLPVTLHRPMNPLAEITMARVTVTRTGPDLGQHLTLAAKIPAVPARVKGRLVAAHGGWRSLGDGTLRVAVAAGMGPVPPQLARSGAVVVNEGGWAEIIVPALWRQEQAGIEKMRGQRDDALNACKAAAARWLEAHEALWAPDAETGLPSPARLMQWRAPGAFAALGRRCSGGEHGDQARELGELLVTWSGKDLPEWRREARARRKMIRRRDDVWGQVAAWLLAGAREIRIDDWDMAVLGRRPGPLDDDDPQAAAARANRVLAAPGDLRARIKTGAPLRGVTVTGYELVSGETQAHWRCGTELDPDARRAGLMVICTGCGAYVDQDVNMLHLMMR